MTTQRALPVLLALLILGPGCRLPDTIGVGYLRGSIDGSSTATLPGGFFGSDADALEAETDLDAEALMVFASWSLTYTQARRNGERLERLERRLSQILEAQQSPPPSPPPSDSPSGSR